MKHAAVITVSSQRGSRDFVVSARAQSWLKGLFIALLSVIIAIGGLVGFALTSLSEVRTQLATLQEEKAKYLQQLEQLQLALEEQSAALQKAQQPSTEDPQSARDVPNAPAATAALSTNKLNGRALLLALVPNGMPLQRTARISSGFGSRRHPVLRVLRQHKGMDFAAPPGTPVYATANGVVSQATIRSRTGYGKQVLVQHALGFSSRYAHLSKVMVKPGERLHKGDLLGHSGNSGRSSGPHLHYEVRYLNKALDPLRFVRWSTHNFDLIFTLEKGVPWASLIKQSRQLTQLAGLPSLPKVAP